MTRFLDYHDDYWNGKNIDTFLKELSFIKRWSEKEKRKEIEKASRPIRRWAKILRDEYHKTYVYGSRDQAGEPDVKRGRKAIREIKRALKDFPLVDFLYVDIKINGEDQTLFEFFENEIAKEARALFKVHEQPRDM